MYIYLAFISVSAIYFT